MAILITLGVIYFTMFYDTKVAKCDSPAVAKDVIDIITDQLVPQYAPNTNMSNFTLRIASATIIDKNNEAGTCYCTATLLVTNKQNGNIRSSPIKISTTKKDYETDVRIQYTVIDMINSFK